MVLGAIPSRVYKAVAVRYGKPDDGLAMFVTTVTLETQSKSPRCNVPIINGSVGYSQEEPHWDDTKFPCPLIYIPSDDPYCFAQLSLEELEDLVVEFKKRIANNGPWDQLKGE